MFYIFSGTAWYDNQSDGLVYAGKVLYKYKGEMPPNTILEIENGINGIADYAFFGCDNLISVTIPKTVSSINHFSFYGCKNLTNIVVDSDNVLFKSEDGVLFTKNGSTLIRYPQGKDETTYNIPEEVSTIAEMAFCGCKNLKSVQFPKSVVVIEDQAFSASKNLSSVVFPPNLTRIGNGSFSSCYDLTTIVLPEYLEFIGMDAFILCEKLSSVISDIMNPFEYSSTVFPSETYTNGTLTVPFGTKAKYQSTKYWNMFTNIVESERKYTLTYIIDGEVYKTYKVEFGAKITPEEEPTKEGYTFSGWSEIPETMPAHDVVVEGYFTLNQVITVTANNYTREYGDDNPSFGYTTSGGALDGTPKISCSATKTSPVGTYTIKIEKGSVTNSNVTFVDGTLTITKAPLTITAKSYSREEGQDNPTFEVTYSGFKNGETSSVLTKKPTVRTTATKDSPAGTYNITVSGAEAQNYSFTYVNGTLTVTEKDLVSFTQNGITYLGTKSTLTANLQSVDINLMNVEIPASLSYDGKTYQVVSVANGALSNRTFNYVSLPSTISSIETGTFKNSTLGALIWYADAALSSSVFSNMSMPTTSNFLLYISSKSYAPSNVSNVVVGTSASSITLADATNTRFYCPKAFTAQTISYTHNYSMKTGGSGMGWETLALPFDVQRIEHKTKGELIAFENYRGSNSQRPFWLYELGSNGFRETNAVKANTPYIIAMPNNPAYDDEYILAGDVTFSATNAKVAETGSVTTSTSNGKTFVPAFAVVSPASSIYALNVVNKLVSNSGSYDAGSRFISNLGAVYPFEAYMTSSAGARYLAIEFDDETTGMYGIYGIPFADRNDGRVRVFSLTGQLIIDATESEYKSLLQQLSPGVYIINGKKTVVKP